jgi:hypothetical protein
MNTRIHALLCAGVLFMGGAAMLRAADEVVTPPLVPPADLVTNPPAMDLQKVLGFAKGLEINPKVIAETEGKGTTVGLQYKYDRQITQGGFFKQTDVELRVHSEGLIVAQHEKSPNRLLTHGLRLSVIDLWPSGRKGDLNQFLQQSNFNNRVLTNYFRPWSRALNRLKILKSQDPNQIAADRRLDWTNAMNEAAEKATLMPLYVQGARDALREYGELRVDEGEGTWQLTDKKGHWQDFRDVVMDRVFRERVVFLSFDLEGDAETDQTFADVQLVGGARLSGKILFPLLDYPFQMLRSGGGPPKNWLNQNGGPTFWGGVSLVDASGNDSRKALTTEHENFTRAHVGLFYRTEVYSTTASDAVALELEWRYYHEFNAPAPLRSRHLDDTSYFRAALLFPGNYFLEYTHGKLPLDLVTSTAVSVGWRHNF